MEDFFFVGYSNGTTSYCCTKQLAMTLDCTVGDVLLHPNWKTAHSLKVFKGRENDGGSRGSSVIKDRYNISETGIYFLLMLACGDPSPRKIVVSGSCEWLNPYGYLPGDVYLKLPMSGVMCIMYVLVFLIYLLLVIRHKNILLKVQYVILFVIFMGVTESAAWFFYRLSNNNTGHYSVTSLFFVILIANLRRVFTYIMVLLISMGFGIVKWTLSTTRVRIGILSFMYLISSFAFQFVAELESVRKGLVVEGLLPRLFLILPNVFLSVVFYYWISLSLIRTIQQLTLRQQKLKLDMYKSLLVVFALTIFMAVLLVLYQAYMLYSKEGQKYHSQTWKYFWLEEFFWEFLFFFVTTAVGVLWRPRENNTRYGYAEFFMDEDGNESERGGGGVGGDGFVNLNGLGGSELSQRRGGDISSSLASPTAVVSDGGSGDDADVEGDVTKISHLTELERDLVNLGFGSDSSEEISSHTQIRKLD
eukprot:TRINITY_DN8773_c1_g1_i3.p1 TRINITY_DN8773_c1_g1~~TRINITY_DN8773_c1_g1_i3.p1  ORF type:complete len:475 (-),score=92.49 TRINITY_DN8773_c1_g1_i3:351-1775(-)